MSWYNLSGTVVQITGAEDLYFHDALRIPNYPTQQAASQHRYTLNAAQSAAVTGAGIQLGLAGGAASVSPVTGGVSGGNTSIATGAGASQLGQDILGQFNLSSWFMRIAEILLGLALIGVGIARLTGADNVVSKALQTKLIP